jgi:predicted DNA-binding antitoxin AbrB/MazE fold protein
MISKSIRAVYSEGQLRLLDSVDLSEGEEIQLVILSDSMSLKHERHSIEERELVALGDLLVEIAEPSGEQIDEEELARQIEEGFRGQPPLSDTLIEERRKGP